MRNPSEKPMATADSSFSRRTFLTRTSAAAALLGMPPWWRAVAGPFEPADFEKLVPRDKKFSAAWLASLTARGTPTESTGTDLAFIGMPVGGIGCGQLYLGGDGRLWHWDVFNQPPPPDASDYRGPHYAKPLEASSPIEQGFALRVGRGADARVRPLDRRGFREIRFRGQYPIGTVEFRDADCPVEVRLEAFSPFIPLAVDDSSLPLTVMEFTVHNPGRSTVEVELAGWMENASCLSSGTAGRGERLNRWNVSRKVSVLEGRARSAPPEPPRTRRPDLLFDDFERAKYERWTATGTAFGEGPIELSKIPEYQGPLDGQGRRVVNTHGGAPGNDVGARDAATGRLVSESFVIERDYINFLIGGGAHRGKTCLNLVIDGKTVLSATGENNNRMRPRSWDVRAWAGRSAHFEAVDEESGPWGNIGFDEILFSDTPRVARGPLENEEDFGSVALALLDAEAGDFGKRQVAATALPAGAFVGGRGDLPRVRPSAGVRVDESVTAAFPEKLVGALGRRLRLRPGRSARVSFLVSWYFPAVRRGSLEHVTGIARLRRAYANRFASARDVVNYVVHERERLFGGTRRWRDTWYADATLPHWFLERTLLNVSILATATCYQFDNGRFYGWEGTYCCAGTCQHVWQYAHSVGRLFPALERSAREMVDFGLAFHADTGAVDYRAEAHRVVAIDGLTGTILRVYREHQMSADDGFLRRLWPRVRKSIEHLLARDTNADGILEGEQYNTLDASWYGEIAWLSSMYCAALRAGAAMATEMGDAAFAERCQGVADRGVRTITARLYNGDYFYHRPDPAHLDTINTNDGCHIDQVFGQSWAMQVGLPRVLPEAETRRALESLWEYNVTPDVGVYRSGFKGVPGGRWYAMPGEGGLLMCTWPKGGAEKAAGKGDATFVGYFNECMTGFEYQVAAHMVAEGLVEKGLAVTRLIHDRYHPAKRNPFNEVECSSHYSRAMASHGVYVAACGFDYHGPRGVLGFRPRLQETNFAAAFVAAEGWGIYRQTTTGSTPRADVELRWGTLRLSELRVPAEVAEGGVTLVKSRSATTANGGPGAPVPATVERQGTHWVFRLTEPVRLLAGESLRVIAG